MKQRNNMGFSLVELIVVIAIMAVLVGVLAPQFIRYVERSRMSTDIQNISLLCHTVETYAADVNTHHVQIPSYNKLVITREEQTVDSASASDDSKYWMLSLENACINSFSLRSSSWFADGKESITIEVYDLNGMPYFKEVDVDPDLSILEGDAIK